MSGNLGYMKKFIILKKDFSNMVGLSPKGHGKLEVKGLKGSVAISIENAPDNDYYNVLLISRNSEYDLGRIYTDDDGRGREDLGFNIQDLESKGFSIDKINGVLIKKGSNVLVGGYIDKNDGSLERFIKQLPIHIEEVEETKIVEIEFLEPVAELLPEQIAIESEPIYEATATEYAIEEPFIEGQKIEETMVETMEDTMEDTIKEEPALIAEEDTLIPEVLSVDDEFKYESTDEIIINQVLEPLAGEDFDPVFEPILELTQEPEPVAQPLLSKQYKVEEVEVLEIDAEQSRRINQRNQTTGYVLNILRFFPYIEPFRIRLEGYNWWKIDFQEEARGFLPYFSYLVGGDQKSRRSDNFVTTKDLMAVYNHYLFGLYTVGEEVKYYVYAVPGGFYKDEHPHGGSTGFNTWFAGQDIGGYWLLYIDPLTGKVIHPINPMNPTD